MYDQSTVIDFVVCHLYTYIYNLTCFDIRSFTRKSFSNIQNGDDKGFHILYLKDK